MQDIILHKNLVFSDDEKQRLLPTIQKILELAQSARKIGILGLEAEVRSETCPFLATGLELVVDGRAPVFVEKVLRSLILTDEHSPAEILRRIIIAEGVLAIQAGTNPDEIACLLGAMLGQKYIAEITANATTRHSVHPPTGKVTMPECTAFEERLSLMNNCDLFRLLGHFPVHDIAAALAGCSTVFIYRIRECVSERTYTHICDELHFMQNISQDMILFCQKEIINTLESLKESREIIEIGDVPIGVPAGLSNRD